MLRWVYRLSVSAALLSAALVGWFAWRGAAGPGAGESSGAVGLLVDRAERDLGELPLGEHAVEFAITTPPAAGGRILGATGSCGWTCCFMPVEDVPVVPLGPGQVYTLRCKVRIFKPGPFDGELTVFEDGGGARPVVLTVRGVGTDSPGGPRHASGIRSGSGP